MKVVFYERSRESSVVIERAVIYNMASTNPFMWQRIGTDPLVLPENIQTGHKE